MKKFLLLLALLVPMIAFTGCGKDDEDEPNVPNQTLNVGQTFTIPVNGEWTSDNKFIASVDGQTLKGVCAGETSIRNGEQSFKVTVQPTLSLYKEPCLQFGSSKNKVKDAMRGFEEVETDSESLSYYYVDGSNVVMYIYNFENDGLKSTAVFLPTKMFTSSQVVDYLLERYIPVDASDKMALMISPDKTVAVGVTVQRVSGVNMYEIIYIPYNPTKSGEDLFNLVENNVVIKGETVENDIYKNIFSNR